jgi:hypothetical protein
MAIDKITPRFLVSDEDERLLQAGAMTDALNVTISEDGEGSEGVIKNVKGTIAGTAVAGSALTAANDVTIIGQVSDSQKNKIYFFVAGNSGSSKDAIYQYDTTTNSYKVVFKSSWLSFDHVGFVKADVVNAAFQQDGVLQSVIYFTDGVNPPRKINVERALAGDFNNMSTNNLDFALNAIKAAPNKPPTAHFETDANLDMNNFLSDSFQFATQIIYTDGEESAISPYSKLYYSKSIAYQGSESNATLQYYENVCVVDLNWSITSSDVDHISDVDRIRLIARAGNTGAFFVVEEFSPFANITRDIYDVIDTVIFNSATQSYRFYNEGVYSAVPTTTVNKMYDNVPQKAVSQAVAGNRLIYSNYTEGYENTAATATLNVKYGNVPNDSAGAFGDTTGSNTIKHVATLAHGDIEIDLTSTDFSWASDGTDIVPAGSQTRLSFKYDPVGGFYGDSDGALILDFLDSNGDPFTVKFGYGGGFNQPIALTAVTVKPEVILDITNEAETTVLGLTDMFIAKLQDGVYASKQMTVSSMPGIIATESGTIHTAGSPFTLDGSLTVNFAFDEAAADVDNDGDFIIKPYITFASLSNITGIGTNTYTTQTWSDDQDGQSDEQSDLTYVYTNTSSYLSGQTVFSSASRTVTSFKSGSTHELGVVYYDKYNRSGFVNKLGSFYVKPFYERASDGSENGPASVEATFTSEPPSWAASYQFVYPGASTFSSFLSYTTGGGYYAKAVASPHATLGNNRKVYVSLKTLEGYQSDKSALRDYSFTEGDKLRVISYDDADNTTPDIKYPKDNNTDNYGPIEFDIVRVEVLSATNNPIAGNDPANTKYHGTFLVLEHPAITSGVQVDAENNDVIDDDLKYVGFDWFSISNTNYPQSDTSSNSNFWGRRCVVEIRTPRKAVADNVFYEIGEHYRANVYGDRYATQHGGVRTISQGDVHLRTVACKTGYYDSSWDNIGTPDIWRYEMITLENSSISDFFSSNDWSRGRAHVEYKSAATINRYNGLTYSDAYAEDVANLSLSSFNPSLGNFESLESKFGAINYIGNYNDDLAAIQENRFAIVPVNKNIIEYAEGSGNVAISTNVLGQVRYSSGDFGCGNHPEAVLVQDNDVFFVDESRQKVLRLVGGQLTAISDKGMSSAFEDFFKAGYTKYVSGFDPRINTYFITGKNGSTGETIGYDVNRKVWQSKYSFVPDIYANQDNMLYSALYNTNGNAFYRHDDNSATPPTNRNMFYEASTAADSMVEIVSKVSPSRVKVYNALSYEGDSALWDMNTGVKTDLGQISGTITSWSKKEGSYYASMPRNTASGSYGSNSEYVYSGNWTCPDLDDTNFLVTNLRPSRLPFSFNGALTLKTFSDAEKSIDIVSFTPSTNGYNVVLASPVSGISGYSSVKITDTLSRTSEDPMRGHWAKIKLTNSSNTKHELYCINTHVTDSKSHHPLGQQ